MDKRGCRKRFMINYDYNAVNQVKFDKGSVVINGVKYKLENKNYVFYPAPEK